jgi:autotransporter strand-loop-strand O-heptosyltransferase
MAHKEQRDFCLRVKEKLPHFFKNKKVLDIGSLDINGSNRDLFEDCNYLGLDVGEGKNVDVVSVGHLFDGPDNYFDTIISTEVFEHDMYYEKTIDNVMRMLKPGGLFIFTCAAPGRPEHGTRRLGQHCAPLLLEISEEWADYYKNLDESDIRKIPKFNETFPDGYFELNNIYLEIPADLYFYGVKGGEQYIVENIVPTNVREEFNDHIFVIDAWPDNESKENDLLSLIKKLKTFNIEILLCTHYPIKEQIQKMVDYYIYDKKNPILLSKEFDNHLVNSGRWTDNTEYIVNNSYEFHHDYAIWETMRNGFNFAKYLNKKYIHFLEYDNIPDDYQYKQSFVEKIQYYDVILYEYAENSIKDQHLSPFCATYIFSIKTDIAIETINQINSKFEYFNDRSKGWQLERVFLDCVKKVTNNIKITDYIANDNELNTQAVWNRDGMNMNGARFQAYPCVDEEGYLYLHLISGYHEKKADKDYLLEVEYDNLKKFIVLKKNEFYLEKLGGYNKGKRLKIYYQGVEVFNEYLKYDYEDFFKINNVKFKNKEPKNPVKININFVNSPFVEIVGESLRQYRIDMLDKNNNLFHTNTIKSNMWVRGNRSYYDNWTINVYEENSLITQHKFNPENQRVYIHLESWAIGDTIGWFPQVEEFRKKHKSEVICSTFHNYLFENVYPEIKFVKPGTIVKNLYAMYTIGWYYNSDDTIDTNKNPNDFRDQHLQKTASDILGLEFNEVKPKINFTPSKRPIDKKYFTIAIHGTAQTKYWNNPTGWQEVVDHLKSKGYEVVLLSKEEDGYMGNKQPNGVIKLSNKTLDEIMNYIHHSEGFIGISSGLSWLAWAIGKNPLFLISGFSRPNLEMSDCIRIFVSDPLNTCNGCSNDFKLDAGDWNWCPKHKGTERQFECSKSITGKQVIDQLEKYL